MFAWFVVHCCSRVTRSLSAKRRRALNVRTSLSQSHRAPYWMRRRRTVVADTNSSGAVVTASTDVRDGADRGTVAGCEGDDLRHSACTSHAHDSGVESNCLAHQMQISDSNGVSSQSSRLASSVLSSVKSSNDKKPVGSDASSRLLELNSNEGHYSAGLASAENVHHRLHCSDEGECCQCTSHNADNAGVLSGPAGCNHSPCLRMSSASTHIDRPWVSSDVLLSLRSYQKSVYLFDFKSHLLHVYD